jgi:peptidoglycan/xylan/chitin deacetylase (PgdA/CDA1 family)
MTAVILLYHSIAENEPADPYAVSRNAFCEQISWLIDQGYEFVSLAALVQSLRKGLGDKTGKQVILTFDDGYQDFTLNAFPILQRHRLPATVFLVTDMLGQKATWSKSGLSVPLMTEEEVRCIKAEGIDLGSHTLTHTDLTALSDHELQRQLVASRQALVDLGETFHSFSYPWGNNTDREAEAVKGAGYECAVGAGWRPGVSRPHLYRLGRRVIHRDLDMNAFQRMMAGPPCHERVWQRVRALGGKAVRMAWRE